MNENKDITNAELEKQIFEMRKGKKTSKIITLVILILLVLNTTLSIFSLLQEKNEVSKDLGKSTKLEEQLKYSAEMTAYMKDIAKNTLEITNDRKVVGEYSTKIEGKIKNISDKNLRNIGITYKFKHKSKLVDYGFDSIVHLDAGESFDFSLYAPDKEFDTFEIYSIEALYE